MDANADLGGVETGSGEPLADPAPSTEKLSAAERRRRKRRLGSGWLRAIDTRGERDPRQLAIGHGRGAIAVGHGAVWVAHGYGRSLVRLDPETLGTTAALGLGKPPAALAVGDDAVWVLGANGWLWRVLPAGPEVEAVTRLGRRGRALAWSGGSLWVLRGGGELAKLDPISGDPVLETRLEGRARHLVAGGEALWASARRGRNLVRIDPASGAVATEVPAPGRVVALALDDGMLWAAWRNRHSRRRGSISAFDARSGELIQEHRLPEPPRALAAGPEAIWVACGRQGKPEGSIARLAPRVGSLEIVDQTRLPICHLALAGPLLLAAMSYGVNTYAGDAGFPLFFETGDLGGGFGDFGGGGGGGDGGGGGGG